MSSNLKLIRLHTFDNEAIFDNQFKDEIIIDEQSEIALQSISLKRDNTDVLIDASNSTITFQLVNGTVRTFQITHGLYSKTEVIDLFKQLNETANSQLSVSVSKELGSQVEFKINDDDKFEYNTKQLGPLVVDDTNINDITTVNMQTTGATKALSQVLEQTTGLLKDSFCFSDKPLISGCGLARTRIRNFLPNGGGNPSSIGIALTTQIEKLKEAGIEFQDCEFAIRTLVDGTNPYQIQTNPTTGFVNTGTNPVRYQTATNITNDVMEIQLNQGNIQIVVHQHGQPANILHSEPHDFNKTYYAVWFCLGNSTINISEFNRVFINPYDETIQTTVFDTDNDGTQAYDSVGAVPRHTTKATFQKLEFEAESIANYFGFNKTSFGPIKTKDFQVIAPSIFQNVLHSDNYIVEMLNMPLDSYDSLSGGRKNILGVIPISEKIINHKTGVLQYEPNEKYYISMNNKYKISLRNIRARVLTTDLSPIITTGLSSLNILIRNSKN